MMKKFLAAAALVAICATGASATDLRTNNTRDEVAADPQSWSGLYFGAGVGYSQTSFDTDVKDVFGPNADLTKKVRDAADAAASDLFTFDTGAFRGTGEVGYDFQVNRFVFGPVAEWTFLSSSEKFSDKKFGDHKISQESEWGIGGRLGVLVTDRDLIYGKALYVERTMKADINIGDHNEVNVDDTRGGYALGLGWDHAFSRNIIVGIEGRWTKLGDATFKVNDTTVVSSVEDVAIMGKLRFLLNQR